MVVWGRFVKTVIGFKHAIHQKNLERSYLIQFCSINRDVISFNSKKIYIKKQFFDFYFLNQDF